MRYTQPQHGPALISPEWAQRGLNSLYMSVGTALVDLTGNYKTALTGTLPTIVIGKAGIGASFDGSTQYLHTPLRALSFGTAFSKFALIVLNSVSSSQTISCTAASTGAQFRINSGNLELLHSATAVVLSAPHGLSVGQLACVGVTYDSTTVRLFVNGRQIGSVACTINFSELGSDTYIGRRDSGVEQFNGVIFAYADFSRGVSTQAAKDLTTNLWQLIYDEDEEEEGLFASTGPATPTGTFAASLADASMAAAGSAVNPGSFASTLASATMNAVGSASASPSGAFAATLSGAAMAASGAITSAGTFAATLAGVSMAAAGAVNNRGVLATTLDGASMSAPGTVAPNATGTLSTTLDGATMTAYGYNGVPPVLAGFFHRLPKNPRHVQRLP